MAGFGVGERRPPCALRMHFLSDTEARFALVSGPDGHVHRPYVAANAGVGAFSYVASERGTDIPIGTAGEDADDGHARGQTRIQRSGRASVATRARLASRAAAACAARDPA